MRKIPVKENRPALQLDGKSGEVQAEIHGGERIFSIADTKKIILQAATARTDAEYKALGELVSKAIRKQNKNGPEYTKS